MDREVRHSEKSNVLSYERGEAPGARGAVQVLGIMQ